MFQMREEEERLREPEGGRGQVVDPDLSKIAPPLASLLDALSFCSLLPSQLYCACFLPSSLLEVVKAASIIKAFSKVFLP